MHENLTDSISDAFKSIHDFITRDKNNLTDEIGLISTQLCKEAYAEDLYLFLKDIIIPKANIQNPIVKNNAFAIFAGFEIILTDEEKRMRNDIFLNTIRNKINSSR